MLIRTLRGTILPALIALFFAASANAQEWAQKMFAEQRHDFGEVARGAEVTHKIKVTNLYEETVHFANVRTSCGCTQAKMSKNSLGKLEEGWLELQLDTVKHSNKKDAKVIITIDMPFTAEVTIPVSAYIRTDVVLQPGVASFGSVDVGSSPSRKIRINYAGRPDWKIVNVRSSNPNIETKVVQTSRNGGSVAYDLDVSLKPDLTLGDFRSQIFLVTDDSGAPQIPVIVEGKVEADITITPDVVALGTLEPGKTGPAINIVVKGKKPFRIEKLECDSDLNAFKVRLDSKSERAVHVIPLTVTAPEKPGRFSETFTLTIEGRPQPVTFKAYGTIKGVETSGSPNPVALP
jgi:hypothetical protein